MYDGEHLKMSAERPHWRSIVLRPRVVGLLLLSELASIAVIVGLWVISSNHNGFIKIAFRYSAEGTFNVLGRFELGQSVLWTTLPTFVFTLYRLFREAVVLALVVETPYIELNRSSVTQRTKVRKSVYVDYRTSFSIVAWYKAIKNRHNFLGLCMLFSFVVSLALVPLAGGLFTEGKEEKKDSTFIDVLSSFDPSTDISFLDYSELFDAVSAAWINTASYPPGTDGNLPFPRVEPSQRIENYTIKTEVRTSQMSLDCRVLQDPTITVEPRTDKIYEVSFSAYDRECSVSGSVLITADERTNPKSFKMTTEQDCLLMSGRTRTTLFYVEASPSGDAQNTTLVSCIPSYWSVSGQLRVDAVTNMNSSTVQKLSFREGARSIQELPDQKRRQFEQGALNVQTISPGNGVNTSSRLADLLARFIEAKNLAFTGDSFVRALTIIYPAVYTMLCLYHFYPATADPIRQAGDLFIPENRLHVEGPIAIAMLAIFALCVAETLYLIFYLRRHPSVLAEEPVGLIGAANLLHDSNIPCLVARFHNDSAFDGCLKRPTIQLSTDVKSSKTFYMDDQLLDRDCWMDKDPTTGRLRIVVDSNDGDGDCERQMHGHVVPDWRRTTAVQTDPVQHTAEQPNRVSVSSISSVSDRGEVDQIHGVPTLTAPIQRYPSMQRRIYPFGDGPSDLWTEK